MQTKPDIEKMAMRASTRVEQVRRTLGECRDLWSEIAAKNPAGINERWLRAFARGQIISPPAQRFMVIERYLVELRKLPARI